MLLIMSLFGLGLIEIVLAFSSIGEGDGFYSLALNCRLMPRMIDYIGR